MKACKNSTKAIGQSKNEIKVADYILGVPVCHIVVMHRDLVLTLQSFEDPEKPIPHDLTPQEMLYSLLLSCNKRQYSYHIQWFPFSIRYGTALSPSPSCYDTSEIHMIIIGTCNCNA